MLYWPKICSRKKNWSNKLNSSKRKCSRINNNLTIIINFSKKIIELTHNNNSNTNTNNNSKVPLNSNCSILMVDRIRIYRTRLGAVWSWVLKIGPIGIKWIFKRMFRKVCLLRELLMSFSSWVIRIAKINNKNNRVILIKMIILCRLRINRGIIIIIIKISSFSKINLSRLNWIVFCLSIRIVEMIKITIIIIIFEFFIDFKCNIL